MSSAVRSVIQDSPGDGVRKRRTRVSIADDSVVARGLFTRWLSEMSDVEITGVHRDGLEAVRQVAEDRPDILILDLEMPGMDGLTALPMLLNGSPQTRVLVVSGKSIRGADITLRCLMRGASDYLTKPSSIRELSTSEDFRAALVERIRDLGASEPGGNAEQASRPGGASPSVVQFSTMRERDRDGAVIPLPSASNVPPPSIPAPVQPAQALGATRPALVAIGASTGGPLAVARLLSALGNTVDMVPVVLAQHMPATYTMLFADHLRRHTGVDAVEISGGERLKAGRVHIARGGQHIEIERDGEAIFARAATGSAAGRWAPSVDILFKSISRSLGPEAVGIVLTGAGDDGAQGVRALALAGGVILAQDESTSANWGMPGAAVRTGLCNAVLPVAGLGQAVARLIHGEKL